MSKERIVENSGPRIEGTRITVYTILEDLRYGHTCAEIARRYRLSVEQVQAAIDYIHAHEKEVNAGLDTILVRINRGNPPHIQAVLAAGHEKLEALLAELRAARAGHAAP